MYVHVPVQCCSWRNKVVLISVVMAGPSTLRQLLLLVVVILSTTESATSISAVLQKKRARQFRGGARKTRQESLLALHGPINAGEDDILEKLHDLSRILSTFAKTPDSANEQEVQAMAVFGNVVVSSNRGVGDNGLTDILRNKKKQNNKSMYSPLE